jgi:L-alanine-DL-glutamate epimerase-like enolase superfamily enzyme
MPHGHCDDVAMPDSLWHRLAELPVVIDSYELERLSATASYGFERVTTQVRLIGGGTDGLGEDVSPFEDEANTLHVLGPVVPLAGSWTLGSLCDHLAGLDQWPVAPSWDVMRRWRNWAFESAAVDLALRQAGRALHEVLGREPRPVRFVNSLGLGDPPTFDPIRRRLEHHPPLRFKLDAHPAWTPELIAELVDTRAVEIIDFKGQYELEIADREALLAMYGRVVATFPDALLEDAHDLPEVTELLAPESQRISYDAPIRSAADLDATPLDVYDAVAQRGLITYGGGMGELDVGRGQIQLLASLFHPGGPNDVAPAGYNADTPAPDLPDSPLAPDPAPTGFRRVPGAVRARP